MFRTFLAATVLPLIALLPACQEESGAPLSTPDDVIAAGRGACPTEITGLIADLFPRGLENAATQQCNNIQRKLAGGDRANAIGKTFNLVGFVLAHHGNGRFDDPNGGDPPTTDEATTDLINALLAFVGLDGMDEGLLGDPNAAVKLCKANTQCVVTTGNKFAGFSGKFSQTTLFTMKRLQDNVNQFGLKFSQHYPLTFDLSGISGGAGASAGLALAATQLAEPGIVGVCVLDNPPDPLGVPAEDLGNIALAHGITDASGEVVDVEILEDAVGGGFELNCEDAESMSPPVELGSLRWWGDRAASAFEPVSEFLVAPLFANPGERRGLISAFSPVGAVDTTSAVGDGGEGGPTTTTLQLNGETENASIVHGETAIATAIVDPAPGNELEPSVTFVLSQFSGDPEPTTATRFLDDGEASVIVQCDTDGSLPPPDGGVEISTTRFVRAEFPGAGAGQFGASTSNTLILGCSAPPSPE